MAKNKKRPLSEKLQDFCYRCVYELASAFNEVLLSGKEYEVGFNEVMYILGVPESKREEIFSKTLFVSQSSGLLYHRLSPLNQFIVTITPYVFYCLINKLPEDEELSQEVQTILNDEDSTFPRYLQEKLGIKISQEIKGALWRPTPIWLSATVVKILIVLFAIFFVGLLYFLKESTILRISSYIAGIVILIAWLYYLFVGKTYTRITGSVSSFTVWQFNILPLLTSICLFLSGNIMFIPLAVLFWVVPMWIIRLSMFHLGASMPFILSLVYGWHIGVRVGEIWVVTFPYWRIVSGILGIIVIEVVCILILNFVTGLYDRNV